MPDAELEVIELDSDGDDIVQVIGEHQNNTRDELPLNQLYTQGDRRVRFGGAQNIDDADDSIEIVEERINTPQRQASPGLVIHTPGGPLNMWSNEGSAEPERRSFQNARGPDNGVHYRRPIVGPSEEALRNRQLEGHRRHEMVLRNQQMRQAPRIQIQPLRPRRLRSRPDTRRRPAATGNYPGQRNAEFNFPMFSTWMGQNFGNLLFEDQDEDEDPSYHPGMHFPHFIPQNRAGFSGFAPGFSPGFEGGNGVDQHIMNLIEQRENQEADKKRAINENSTRLIQKQCEEKLKTIKTPYSNKLDPEEEYVCLLCGVTLGEGIPNDFKGNIENIKLPILQEQNDVQAPYSAINLITDADRDLSKRIFMSTCGHTYCGRCVKNISSVKETLKEMKKNKIKWKKTDQDINSPFLYAPSKCLGPNCGVGLCASRRFIEVYI